LRKFKNRKGEIGQFGKAMKEEERGCADRGGKWHFQDHPHIMESAKPLREVLVTNRNGELHQMADIFEKT